MVIQETPKAESLQEQRLKISLKAGCARHAEWESNTSRKRNKDSTGLQVRGKQVMIDKDLALLYGVETKRLNEQVKRNIERFPEDFMFQLTQEECLRSQFATLNQAQGKHLKYLPFAFTENGIAMLSSVLRSETAIAVNIKIMRTFTKIRKSVPQDSNLLNRVELIEYNQSDMRKLLLETNIEHINLLASHTVPQKQALFSVSMLPNGGSRSKTAIVTEKPADSSVTMT